MAYSQLTRRKAKAARAAGLLLALAATPAAADIYQWEWIDPADQSKGRQPSATLTPGGAGLLPAPAANLSARNLNQAFLDGANLQDANLSQSVFIGASFVAANLEEANLTAAYLTDADFTNAIILAASFDSTIGFTPEQLYSTASHKTKNLMVLKLRHLDLGGWDFAGQDMNGSIFSHSSLVGTNLGAANLANSNFFNANLTTARLAGANLTGAIFLDAAIDAASFDGATGFTAEQLYSTASYQAGNLAVLQLRNLNMTGWNLAQQNLRGVLLHHSNLTSADLKTSDLSGAFLFNTNLTSAQLRDAILTNTEMGGAILTNADLRGADLRGSNVTASQLATANAANAIRPDATIAGLSLSAGQTLLVRNYSATTPIEVKQSAALGGGTLRILLSGAAWNSVIAFEPGINVNLAGANLALDGTFAGEVKLFDFSGVNPSGRFRVMSNGSWDTTNLYSAGTVSMLPQTTVAIGAGGARTASRVLANRLEVLSGASLTIDRNGGDSGSSRVNSLSIANGAQLDLADNALVVQSTAANRLAVLNELNQWVNSARNGGDALWTGPGLTSNVAAQNDLLGLAVLLNDSGLGRPFHVTFGGHEVNANSVLVKLTWTGDMTLDGKINADDYFLIDSGFLRQNSFFQQDGDLNGDGRIDADDYFLIDRGFLSQGAALPGANNLAAIPEPHATALLAIGALTLLRRIRRPNA